MAAFELERLSRPRVFKDETAQGFDTGPATSNRAGLSSRALYYAE